MKKTDFQEFCKVLDLTAAAYPGMKPITDEAKYMYFQALTPHELGTIRKAINLHLRSENGRFFPRICDIEAQIRGTDKERSENAWSFLLMVMKKHGAYDSLIFPNPAYMYAIEKLGGWLEICEVFRRLTDREVEFEGNKFKTFYLQGEKVATFDEVPGKIRVKRHAVGILERDNKANGWGVEHIRAVELSTGRKIPLSEITEPEINKISEFSKIRGELTAQLSR